MKTQPVAPGRPEFFKFDNLTQQSAECVLAEQAVRTLEQEVSFNCQEYTFGSEQERASLNLAGATRVRLLEAGVVDEHIEIADRSTTMDQEMFFSVRREGETGRFSACVMLASQ
jgi:copper oxidase (laccase) domain-containing protein